MKKATFYSVLFLSMLVIGVYISKDEGASYVSTISNSNTIAGDEEFFTDVDDIKEIYNQLGVKFKITAPEDFKITYMAKASQPLVDKGRINPWAKFVYTKDEKQITVQIVKGTELFQYARINYDAIENSKVQAFYDIETKRIIYSQDEYTILIDIEGMEQDLSLVEMVQLEKNK